VAEEAEETSRCPGHKECQTTGLEERGAAELMKEEGGTWA